VCSKLNRHVQMKVAERGMNNLDEEF